MDLQDVKIFNLFEFLHNLNERDHFSVFYDPGDEPGKEVYSFMGSVREKNNDRMLIDYTFQDEWYFGHSVCYGMMDLNPKTKTVFCYSLKDKYDECFTPHVSSIFGAFDDAEKQEFIDYWIRESDKNPKSSTKWMNDRYSSAEWVDDKRIVPWTENGRDV